MAHLISITPSHYCEKSRWSLERAGIVFQESRYAPFFHVKPVKKAGGERSTPILVTESETLCDSIAISGWIQEQQRDFLPYGDDLEKRERIREWEHYCGQKIGPHTRRVAYHYLLPHKDLVLLCMQHPVTEDAAPWLFSTLFPIFRFLMRKAMNINAITAEKSLQKLRERLQEIEERADGAFLVGDRLTIADISFAALLAPIVLPNGYGATLPAIEDLTPELRALVQEFREHPAGQRCLRLYQEYR